ncbi:MAG: NAD-dependent epimerase/dehydratase family protein, partial [Planctomycetota bacterium]
VLAGRRRPAFWPVATPFVAADLERTGQLAGRVAELRPAVVLHAAGVSRGAEAEADPARARRLNGEAVADLAAAAAAAGAALILVSTDLVFAGDRERYFEEDRPDAVGVYGASKAAGEAAALAAGQYVVRLPLLLAGDAGRGRRGADTALLADLAAGRRPRLFTDEIRCPVAAELAAAGLYRLASRLAAGDRPAAPGRVFHLAGGEPVDRHRLGREICRAAGVAPAFAAARAAEVAPERPRRLVLDCAWAERELGWKPPDLRQSLARRFPAGR